MGISNAVVVGGGVGGLAVATCLARRGVAVTLVEQAPRYGIIGAGIQISPNGVAVLRAMGLEAELKRKGAVQGQAVVLKDLRDENTVARLDLKRLRPEDKYYFLHRADLIDILAGAAKRENVTFEMGMRVKTYHYGAFGRVILEDGSERRGEVVVAADGLHSPARKMLNGESKAKFSGQIAWRAVVPNTINHPPEAHVAMGNGQHLVSYPIRNGQLINLVAVQERSEWSAEGWTYYDEPRNVHEAFANAGHQTREMLAYLDTVALWGLHLHPVAKNWHAPGVALLGDAAHPTLPFLAQGANMALEDAWVFAACMAGQGPADLEGYQMRREMRVHKVVKAAEKNATGYHLPPGFKRSLAHKGLGFASRFAPGRMLGAFDWLYGVDVTKDG